MAYQPQPLDTAHTELAPEILELTELLARNIHEVWAQGRMNEGWSYGAQRNDERREHPGLVAYEELDESEKEYDRNTALQTLRTIIALGYKIEKGE